jgi:hypothetical protein
LQSGTHHLDMYDYRIGACMVGSKVLAKLTPGTPESYPLSKQFPQKFLWDRPEIQDELGNYLRGLNGKTRVN